MSEILDPINGLPVPLPNWPSNDPIQWFKDDQSDEQSLADFVCQDLADRKVKIRNDPGNDPSWTVGACYNFAGSSNDPLAMNGFNVTLQVFWNGGPSSNCIPSKPDFGGAGYDFAAYGTRNCTAAFNQISTACTVASKPYGVYDCIGGQTWWNCLQFGLIAGRDPPPDTYQDGGINADVANRLANGAHEVP